MFDEQTLLRVIAKLMMQVEEERQRRVELIRAFAHVSNSGPHSVETPSAEDIERRIVELS